MEVSDQLNAPPLYPQGKSPWYPLDRRLGGPQSRSGHGGEEENSQPPPGIEILEILTTHICLVSRSENKWSLPSSLSILVRGFMLLGIRVWYAVSQKERDRDKWTNYTQKTTQTLITHCANIVNKQKSET
jgi:hypothetical protein